MTQVQGRGRVVVRGVDSGAVCVDPPPGLTPSMLFGLRQSTGLTGASGSPSGICGMIFMLQGL